MKQLIYTILMAMFCFGCDGFLDEKPQRSLVVPSTLADLQALLDNELLLMNLSPGISVILSDEFYLTEGNLQSLSSPSERNGYVWADDLYEGGSNVEWVRMYEQIFYSNVVLETLEGIQRTLVNQDQYDQIKGSAIFYRAHAYFNLLTLFCAMIQDDSNLDQFGLVIKETAAIESPPYRITVTESYSFVENQLNEAFALLQLNNTFKTRPSKIATKAALSRFYLFKGDFAKAEEAAEYVWNNSNNILDYHDINPIPAAPFSRFNQEVIFHSNTISNTTNLIAEVSPDLYNSYNSDDLRKTRFFNVAANGRVTFKGSYTGLRTLFSGITTTEILLILSECKIRNGKLDEGVELLNTLKEKRYDRSTFQEKILENREDALREVFLERSKELILRSLSWYDLRRLNHEDEFQRILVKQVGDQVFTLMPNDLFYILPIIDIEIQTYGLPQNP